ncbi:bifunctional UDP-N-acetylmuramoyl-tripeptide:D-alanyl-D-alanine ligase/alanine racemase [Ancylomarina longa]|uniref:Alanine racemase n=1 Tax=Ancylomarina longa TaxID=2487017 RepID=A0A434AVK7_9BACT|nr:bifunctional UDP-N-acetylmuramoyl-tripeptide:D-alanyl-D-alanine ligase/alanine racemase [Ancylomarina longa]RUT78489.1 bifunctional UDP-N-acetylmuramoyl-tripeptide:D-alanyl-D-alanine ligase/alanine racemase [Ancylomarina longa]
MRSANNYTIKFISQILTGSLIGNPNLKIHSLSIDSRSLIIPNEALFFALQGERHDGHSHIIELYEKGVRAYVVSNKDSILPDEEFGDAAFILVDNTLTALQSLAQYHRNRFSYPVLGITGSNGKTIVKEWLYQLLCENYSVVRSPKSYNSQIGVPLSIWNMAEESNMAIIEAGISKPNEMQHLAKIIQPSIGLFTHLGDAHRENFASDKQKLEEKIKLFDSCNWIAYCVDEELVHQELYKKFGTEKRLVCWSRKENANLRILTEISENKRTKLKGIYYECIKEIEIPFTDKASIDNAILCWLFLLLLEVDDSEIKRRFSNLEPVAMRMEIKEGIGESTIINDYYNSDLGSLEIALNLMNQQKTDKKKTLILSDIYQTGYSPKKLYREVSKILKQKKVDRIIGIGEGIASQSELFSLEKSFYRTTDIFLSDLNRNEFKNEIILIKGSRSFHFERISNALQYKAHRTVLEVNLNAMVYNLNYFRSLLKPSTKIVVMVKAFSYGSGSTEIANLLQYHRVDYLAVAIADEGVELRNAGITIPIIVMNPEIHSFETIIEYQLEPEIYNISILQEFEKSLKRSGVKNYPIHIKLDTGMHRLGFMQHDLNDLILQLRKNDNFYIRSIFSHLAGADEEQHDIYTEKQIKSFISWCDIIRSNFNYPIDRHILNSAGIERFPDAQFEMVRLGIGLYGIGTFRHQENLMNVSSLKTSISQIKTISSSETIGYSRKGTLEKETAIGIIPIGYADGFNRRLSNGVGKVMINGKLCPIIGNICMDMSMVDLSDVSANEGDEVIIFGDDYPVTIISKQLDTISYEVLTTISRRVKRIYYQE